MHIRLPLYCLPLLLFSLGIIRYETKLPLLKMRDNEIPIEKVKFKTANILTDERFIAYQKER